jgi:hypothetical protein
MYERTTVLLDRESRRVAKELAARLDVSPSEIIRRALRAYRSIAGKVDPDQRRRRLRAARRLDALFRSVDAKGEIADRKREDASW